MSFPRTARATLGRATLRAPPPTGTTPRTSGLLVALACLSTCSVSGTALRTTAMPALRVVTVPILEDNYAYIIIDEDSKQAAAVDPADASTVVAAASRERVQLTHVLTTHSHWDHAGGNADMVKLCPGIEVVGGKGDNAAAADLSQPAGGRRAAKSAPWPRRSAASAKERRVGTHK